MNDRTVALWRFAKAVVWPDDFYSKLGAILAGISMLALIREAMNVGFANTINGILDWYDKFLDIAVGWIAVELLKIINLALSAFSLNIDVFPHWKHIFILMNIYFVRDAMSHLSEKRWQPVRFSSQIVLGLLVSLTYSFAAGVLPDSGVSIFSSLSIAVLPLVGFFIYDWFERRWYVKYHSETTAFSGLDVTEEYGKRFYQNRVLERALLYLSTSVLATWLWYWFLGVGRPGAGVFALLATMLVMAFYWISGRASLHFHMKSHEYEHIPWPMKQLIGAGTAYLGGLMLSAFFWLGVFLVSNAGLGLVGL